MKLSGKVCIVTGASSGMGKATALQFAKEGAKGLVLVSRTLEKLQATKDEILAELASSSSIQIEVLAGDCSVEATNKDMVEMCLKSFGGQLDAVFVNAGSVAQKKLVDVEEADVDQQLNSNYKSVVWALKHCMKVMDGGSIVVNTSCMGSTARAPFSGSSLYSASKAAANMLVKYAAIEAVELKKSEDSVATRVNAIAPGIVATNLVGMGVDQMDGFAKGAQLTGKAGRAEEVASFVTYLASDDASFITGSIHLIDGGWSLKA